MATGLPDTDLDLLRAEPDGSEPPRPLWRRALSVRGNLALFAAALLLPIMLFSAALVWGYASSERTRLEREASEVAQLIAGLIDSHMTGLFATLDILSTSPYLKSGDFESFHKQALELQQRQGLVTVLTDPTGRQLANTRLAWGEPLPSSYSSFVSSALDSDQPRVGDLVTGRVTGMLQLVVTKTVRDETGARYVLFFALPLSRIQRILADAELGAIYNASIIDRQYNIVARSRRPEEFVGKHATQALEDQTRGRRQGTWFGKTADGEDVFSAFARSRLSDFLVSVSIRLGDLNAPLWRSLLLVAALGIAVTGLTTLLALWLGGRIASAISNLAAQAKALARGEPVQPLATGLAEANQVGAELASASAELRARETELHLANEELQRFAYIVSHDLRSPLVNIMGFTTELEAVREDVFRRLAELREAAGKEGSPDADLRSDFDEAIGFIKASISKMDRLINAILGVSREGRRTFSPERVDMGAMIEGIRASLAHQAEQADATVSIGRLPPVLSDRLALEQIFSNLIDNALKYLRDGVPGRIDVRGHAGPDGIVYQVRDNGRGIDSKDRERVFELFRRSGVQDRPGEGIGLAHVRALVRRLGGTINLTSEPGQGSTFAITLPRRWAGEGQRKAA